jgi:hypothetical protein
MPKLMVIPGTLEFVADDEGNIFDSNMVKRTTYRNGDGYMTCSVLTETKKWVTYGVARLVALAHLLHLKKPEHTQVNHRDSDLSNNRVTNLEWVTESENNIHSEIMRVDNQYSTVVVYNDRDQVITMCLNAHIAASMFGVTALDVWDSVRSGWFVMTPDGREVKFAHLPHNARRPITQDKREVAKRSLQEPRPVKLRDIVTGEVIEYPTMTAAAKAVGVKNNQVFRAVQKTDKLRLLKKQYQAAYLEDSFPMYSQMDVQDALNHGAREVTAYNYQTGIFYVYESAKEFIAATGLSKKAVTTSLRKEKLRRICDWAMMYLSPENVKKLREFVGCPEITITRF